MFKACCSTPPERRGGQDGGGRRLHRPPEPPRLMGITEGALEPEPELAPGEEPEVAAVLTGSLCSPGKFREKHALLKRTV